MTTGHGPGPTPAELARRVAAAVGGAPDGTPSRVAGGEICDAYRVPLDDGRTVFAKTRAGAPADFFTAEAAGLDLLRGTGAVAVPEVLAARPGLLVLSWVEPAGPSPRQAERLGRELAALHATPAAHYGTAGPLYLGPVPLRTPEPVSDPADWPAWHAAHRLLPLLRLAVDGGGIDRRDAADVTAVCERIAELAGPPQPPAVIHGDLWAGNILWTAGPRPYLIDPAAQGGHPEADLAFLELSGCPHFDRLIGAYQEVRPLPHRAAHAPLHQLHHILIHAALFGGGYGQESGDAARAVLRTGG
ncbi:fructosamine kinase family protein [Streptomyces sp. DSM 44915]|uniref:Fructosamine kinase family protein n=1 Tax=Streptomyces chisholmiae TaxID=3075540 RepID=A0ABU2JQQ4_9ACTN|nr:fructosamine kinase family protein [Streptomyces sp. DSM 44915]MDT0267066.1 fructosamine kinase family protein [Streptomyces sp. DSM 44915]